MRGEAVIAAASVGEVVDALFDVWDVDAQQAGGLARDLAQHALVEGDEVDAALLSEVGGLV